jgi:hypothetical protein
MTQNGPSEPFETEARAIIASLPGHLCSQLAASLDPFALAESLRATPTHKAHPIAELVRAAGSISQGHATQVLANLERALRASLLDTSGTSSSWASRHLREACTELAFENAAAKLGELRAFGFLWDANFNVTPVHTTTSPTRDFDVVLGESTFGVEVHTKQMNIQQAQKLAAAGICETYVYPAGQPRDNESTAENVAQKFAQIKPRAKQAAKELPTVLWLDLQDFDWWVISGTHAEPVAVDRQLFYSGGLWHAIYGEIGTPFFEHHSTEECAIEQVPKMAHPGLLKQWPDWAGVVLSIARSTIFFENPDATNPLPDIVLEAMPRLPWFELSTSRMNWPDNSLESQLAADRTRLVELAKRARFYW